MTHTAPLRFLLLPTVLLALAHAAGAQPFIGDFESTAGTALWVDDSGGVGSTDFDLLTYSKLESGSGHLSDPPGSMSDIAYQDCMGNSAVDGSVQGPVAPFISTDASMAGTQNGTIFTSSFPCTSQGVGGLIWDFAFYSPTFWSVGGDGLPIAFNISGEATASGGCTGSGFCGPISSARIEIDEQTGMGAFLRASAIASEAGPTSDLMNTDLVGDMFNTWEVFANADSTEGGWAFVLGGSGSGASVASVNDLQLIVDFALTEALIKLADPTLPQATIDQGLGDLELLVSPGVDVTAFAPQFPLPEADGQSMLLAGLGALILLDRRRARRRRRTPSSREIALVSS